MTWPTTPGECGEHVTLRGKPRSHEPSHHRRQHSCSKTVLSYTRTIHRSRNSRRDVPRPTAMCALYRRSVCQRLQQGQGGAVVPTGPTYADSKGAPQKTRIASPLPPGSGGTSRPACGCELDVLFNTRSGCTRPAPTASTLMQRGFMRFY